MSICSKELTHGVLGKLQAASKEYLASIVPSDSCMLHPSQMLSIIRDVDFRGCNLKVLSSLGFNYVGLNGIVVDETKNMWYVCVVPGSVVGVPKRGSRCFINVGTCKVDANPQSLVVRNV